MRIAIFLAAAGGAALLVPSVAFANGRFPQSDQLIFSPTDPNLIVLRATYGILPSHDNGKTWSFVCEDALGISTASALQDPPIALTENNALTVGGPLGLNVSADVGCNWTCAGGPLAGQNVIDLAVRPDAPSSEVALTQTYLKNDSGQQAMYTQVFETTDNGAHWVALGVPLDPLVVATTVEVSKADPNRIYVSGTRDFGSSAKASLFVMNKADPNPAWTEWVIPPAQFDGGQEVGIYIGAIDPTNADRVYLRTQSQPTGGLSRLMLATLGPDGGAPLFEALKTFVVTVADGAVPPLVGEMLGFALSPDGSKVYIGNIQDGLWVGRWAGQPSALTFQKTASIEVQCLATRGAELWACAPAKDGFVAGMSTDDGKTFAPKLRLIGDLTGPIACPPNPTGAACDQDANSSQCNGPYNDFCALNICETADASMPVTDTGDAAPGNDASTGKGATKSSSCSCDLASAGRGGAAALAAGFAVAAMAMRRRKNSR